MSDKELFYKSHRQLTATIESLRAEIDRLNASRHEYRQTISDVETERDRYRDQVADLLKDLGDTQVLEVRYRKALQSIVDYELLIESKAAVGIAHKALEKGEQ